MGRTICHRPPRRPLPLADPSPLDWTLPPGVDAVLTSEPDGSVLTDAERARWASFGHADRRRQFVLGRTAARALGARRLRCAPAEVPLGLGEDGAPTLDGAFVSIAHGGRGEDAVGAAALADRAVGVDVEAVAPGGPTCGRASSATRNAPSSTPSAARRTARRRCCGRSRRPSSKPSGRASEPAVGPSFSPWRPTARRPRPARRRPPAARVAGGSATDASAGCGSPSPGPIRRSRRGSRRSGSRSQTH